MDVHGAVTATQLNGITETTAPINSLLNNQTSNNDLTPQKPKAFINYVLFDEQFRCVGSGFAPVGDNGVLKDYAAESALHNIAVTKNGFVYIYCSNESPVDVFFDNLQVVQTKGPILEETHYYPFGLTMAGISSKAADGIENKKKYNGIEFNNDLDLNTYEAFYRNLDPQTGRWWQIDPKVDAGYENLSPYASMYNDPVRHSDLLGDEAGPGPGILQLGEYALNIYRAIRGGENVVDAIKNNSISVSGVLESLQPFGQGGLIIPPANSSPKTAKLTLPPDTYVLIQPADTKVDSRAKKRAAKLSEKDRSGKDFTKAGKKAVKNVNKEKNNGEMVCENCGTRTQNASKHTRSQTPPSNEAHVDHINPKSNGGSGTPDNGQVLCRDCNLKKGAN